MPRGISTTAEGRAAQLANLDPYANKRDLTGQRFGRLVVGADTGERRGPQPVWSWVCDCGATGVSQGRHLRNGSVQSCGCLRREQAARTSAARKGLDVTDAPEYATVHKRLRRRRGPASAHPCADCGATAQDWSYDGLDPEELEGQAGRDVLRYSTDLARYQPRCRTCHNRFDRGSSV